MRKVLLVITVLTSLHAGPGWSGPSSQDNHESQSTWRIVARREGASADPPRAQVVVDARLLADNGRDSSPPAPVRVIARGADGKFIDGGGKGLYADGRFFAEGRFDLLAPAGKLELDVSSGPHRWPLSIEIDVTAAERVELRLQLATWFSPRARGWYCGDNHVHAQHDSHAKVRTDLAYAALQGRANGLDFMTEAGSSVSYDRIDSLGSETFILRRANEVRPGCFAGHLNTPGAGASISAARLEGIGKGALPARAIVAWARSQGGVAIHTHPLTPPHQAHWMGATEILADAVAGTTVADALDLDSRATEELWFALLNLGHRIAASSYTDAALGRVRTRSPGDRRIYCRAGSFDYESIVDAVRHGRTLATSGGPLLVFLECGGREPGEVLEPGEGGEYKVAIETASRRPLRSLELIWRGRKLRSLPVRDASGVRQWRAVLPLPPASDERPGWLVARVEDEAGDWAITSPVYFESGDKPTPRRPCSALVLQISNATRFIELRPQFHAHVLATVDASRRLQRVTLYRDGERVKGFDPAAGDRLAGGKYPVTALRGEYAPGWAWTRREDGSAYHLQADWPVDRSGWYHLVATTSEGVEIESDAVHFDALCPRSHQLTTAGLRGAHTELRWWGYGEEMDLADIDLPFEGDHWWYPENTWWRLETRFDGERNVLGGGGFSGASRLFREPELARSGGATLEPSDDRP